MTTQINIVVDDDGGLIQRNKEQTDGNRWLTLEKNGQKLIARKAQEERDQELKKQGKALDGSPQNTTPAKPTFRRDEPAAQRSLATQAHGWADLTSEKQSNPSTGDLGVYASGVTSYVTPFSSLYEGEGYYEFKVFCGDGSSKITLPRIQQSAVSPHPAQLPIDYELIPYFGSSNGVGLWSAVGVGRRAHAVNRINPRLSYNWAGFPSGNGNFIFVLYLRFRQYDINMNATVWRYADINPQQSSAAALAAAQQIDFSNATTWYLVPPSGVIVGDNTVIAGSPPSYSLLNNQSTAATYAFACNNTKIRQIAVPSYFNSLNPQSANRDFSYVFGASGGGTETYGPGISVPADWFDLGLNTIPGLDYYLPVHPFLFKEHNDHTQFADPSETKAYPDIYSLDKDFSKGGYAGNYTAKAAFAQNAPFYYKRRRNLDSSYAPINRPSLTLSSSRLGYIPLSNEAIQAWGGDAGEVAYCRKMLTAMGFTAADFTP